MPTFVELNEQIYESLKSLRKTPKEFARIVRKKLPNYKSHGLYHRDGFIPVKYIEGRQAAEALIEELKDLDALPKLSKSNGLTSAALHLAYLISQGVEMEDISPTKTIGEYGYWYGNVLMLIDEGNIEGDEVVQSLLLDDGLKEKTNKKAILNPSMKLCGIGAVPKEVSGALVVILVATDFIEKKDANEVVPSEDELPKYPELDQWVEDAVKLDCEITHESIGDKTITRVKQSWQLADSSTVITEKVIE
ncbi:hypothetical protein SteCoe_24784 [Stentor coeruleus]|uniref:SCP domain-containing protein n=1 Tax=Stentor coeruleus TaxID=5963 RepID=A0A1R2BH64_9CILI|nr:hypothetical protein SteCoe_24784 [Stentor coeruleus]